MTASYYLYCYFSRSRVVIVHEVLQPLILSNPRPDTLAIDPERDSQSDNKEEECTENVENYQWTSLTSISILFLTCLRSELTLANQSLTKYVKPNVSRFLALIATNASSLSLG